MQHVMKEHPVTVNTYFILFFVMIFVISFVPLLVDCFYMGF